MDLPPKRRLEEYEDLDRTLLHLFVAGPGKGEGLALALPESGWILIDGCKASQRQDLAQGTRTRFPLQAIYERWRRGPEDKVSTMVYTHPHGDHLQGFTHLLDRYKPTTVAVPGMSPPKPHIGQVAMGLAKTHKGLPADRYKNAGVLQLFKAIHSWSEHKQHTLLSAHDGVALSTEDSPVCLFVRAPDQKRMAQWHDYGSLIQRMTRNANWFSAVIEVQFGETRVVLGGDLPVRQGRVDLGCGWNAVLSNHPHLCSHQGFKIPHHGSAEAIHSDFLEPSQKPRAWVVTPYNSSGIPCTDGIVSLTNTQSPVMITAFPMSGRLQSAMDHGELSISDQAEVLEHCKVKKRINPLAVGKEEIRPRTGCAPLDPIWCIAFDDQGAVTSRWRGRAAFEVHAKRNST